MSRNIIDAALRLSKASAEEIQTIAAHDWDMIREVATVFLADRREALLKEAREKPHRTCSHGAPI